MQFGLPTQSRLVLIGTESRVQVSWSITYTGCDKTWRIIRQSCVGSHGTRSRLSSESQYPTCKFVFSHVGRKAISFLTRHGHSPLRSCQHIVYQCLRWCVFVWKPAWGKKVRKRSTSVKVPLKGLKADTTAAGQCDTNVFWEKRLNIIRTLAISVTGQHMLLKLGHTKSIVNVASQNLKLE